MDWTSYPMVAGLLFLWIVAVGSIMCVISLCNIAHELKSANIIAEPARRDNGGKVV